MAQSEIQPPAGHAAPLDVAVVMRRERLHGPSSHWQPWRWTLGEVVPDEPGFGREPRLLHEDDEEQRWLHPGFKVELFRDEAEGYHLNVSSPAPCWFVLWRMDEEATVAAEPIPRPVVVTLSYYEAGRWLDAQETVEQVPAPPEVVTWLRAFVDEHYVVEPKRRKRPESFRSLTDRFGNAVSVSTEKPRGRGAGDV
ncbi:DUF3305 domain-containing protein [Variovorax sp. Sphag1AA]|uniref:DUF3305 domain-containing protein n=1 Tax=Variovorax sp. Sphag1AA TaxID=2587027 RepID=UPI00161E760B|nr:DUF3305 domain-containing protein [Variovorax sp. Sphag1AA]MBB3177449.1 hypothetical protein [Variovorax sp. Sphag1AA]